MHSGKCLCEWLSTLSIWQTQEGTGQGCPLIGPCPPSARIQLYHRQVGLWISVIEGFRGVLRKTSKLSYTSKQNSFSLWKINHFISTIFLHRVKFNIHILYQGTDKGKSYKVYFMTSVPEVRRSMLPGFHQIDTGFCSFQIFQRWEKCLVI